ncbi:hypothetical protein MLD38_018488 [Melastoma candidum]|uniref:Uncharacterized protein n=1 Tax=Melastoma candidum TaxID=119954 RepID=A0ACB9QTE5_9MYRT|nr:hypothetical protein MLD38_018488 [Melastoma candidum]
MTGDLSILRNLVLQTDAQCIILVEKESYKEERTLMMQKGQRVEIESLYYHSYDFLGKYIMKKILQVDYSLQRLAFQCTR